MIWIYPLVALGLIICGLLPALWKPSWWWLLSGFLGAVCVPLLFGVLAMEWLDRMYPGWWR
jgi:hypothetical protein